jgi:predicted 3-demethylubiquinone-9 3-methyltransferase (glyoxalase superfamily)
LWFDKEAKEATGFYTSLFENSRIARVTTLRDTLSGDTDVVSFTLSGQPFMAISAGPLFRFNPSVSFLIAGKTNAQVQDLWDRLAAGGTVLMALGEYPFSGKYGWLQDKYGLSWQLMVTEGRETKQRITPTLMFVGAVSGKAEEAIDHYVAVFKHAPAKRGESAVGNVMRYAKGMAPDKEGTIAHAAFTLDGQEFAAMDSARQHQFAFNEAISFMVYCDTQREIDYYWEKLSAVPEAEQCGWLKDKYGVSWQVVPSVMDDMMGKGTKEQISRVTAAFLKMKKFDIAALEKAFKG